MTDRKRNFIVIDDNKLDCFIGKKIILNTGVSDKIHLFLDAGEALELIKSGEAVDNDEKIIIIVDIQMPLMNGFEFVEAFETLPDEIQARYRIFMLSSSINENDLNRVRNYKSVIEIISKPLSIKKLVSFID
jgi:CheY-like chemotaxis protein